MSTKSIATSTDLSISTLASIAEKGLVPAAKLEEESGLAHKSFDEAANREISINCVQKVDGIAVSLMHEAKGGLAVTLERKPDHAFEDFRSRKSSEISKAKLEIPSMLGAKVVKQAALQLIASSDSKIVSTLTDRINRSALLILAIPPTSLEKDSSLDGSKETKRSSVDKSSISYVLIGEALLSEVPADQISKLTGIPVERIVKVSSIKSKDLRYPVSVDKEKMPLKILESIAHPDYETAIRDMIKTNQIPLPTVEKPIFTHMTRLYTDEDHESLINEKTEKTHQLESLKIKDANDEKVAKELSQRIKQIDTLLNQAEKIAKVRAD